MGHEPGYHSYYSSLITATSSLHPALSSCHSGSMALTELPESNLALQHHSSMESLAFVCLHLLLQTGNFPRGMSLIRGILMVAARHQGDYVHIMLRDPRQ